jgi:hypothetical protein
MERIHKLLSLLLPFLVFIFITNILGMGIAGICGDETVTMIGILFQCMFLVIVMTVTWMHMKYRELI